MRVEELRFLKTRALPFCRGCGHHHVGFNLEKALQGIPGLSPLDVIVVTDIGCHGIIDKDLNTHTVHGLHGRSVALGEAIAMALENPDKKVIAMIGDGGATLGVNHLVEAANRNVPMTVIIHNNFLYGMTGGQPSGLTPEGFHTRTTPQGKEEPGYRLAELLATAGASLVYRVVGLGDYAEVLREAVERDGFSVVEVVELCTAYAVKFNPGLKLRAIVEEQGYAVGKIADQPRKPFRLPPPRDTRSLLEGLPVRESAGEAPLTRPVGIVMAGSAGEGVQKAAELFALAGMRAGLFASKKGSYPVTVGVGFSTAEVLLAPREIHYTGIQKPDVMIFTSEDGLRHSGHRARTMDPEGVVYVDVTLPVPETPAQVRQADFRARAGARNAMLAALIHFLREEKLFPVDLLKAEIQESHLAGKIPLSRLGLED